MAIIFELFLFISAKSLKPVQAQIRAFKNSSCSLLSTLFCIFLLVFLA
ncbi:MAG: hypothetical protein MR582_06080 [Campylobacter sp.]|nr:hypothetical protein [Campylobacter sp.]MCI6299192.1 hypothetical protein [Campylobacter sp.]MCI6694975.1 hypothetical protein [Campylobacter sp.]